MNKNAIFNAYALRLRKDNSELYFGGLREGKIQRFSALRDAKLFLPWTNNQIMYRLIDLIKSRGWKCRVVNISVQAEEPKI